MTYIVFGGTLNLALSVYLLLMAISSSNLVISNFAHKHIIALSAIPELFVIFFPQSEQ